MKILMFTNSCMTRIGGVTQSVQSLRTELSARGHAVLTVAPSDPDAQAHQDDVVRVPVFAHLKAADLPVPIMSRAARRRIAAFRPDLVHSHHPFLLGRTALHTAARLGVPLVYTFHTRYDLYAGSAGHGSPLFAALLRRMMLGYCRVADAVIAPSNSVRDMLLSSNLTTPIFTIPTGVDTRRVVGGDGLRLRAQLGIAQDAFVAGHIGRLQPEKNLGYLASAIGAFLRLTPDAAFLLGGDGSQRPAMLEILRACGVEDRVFCLGPLQGRAIADAYAAMDVFTFSSFSETQGLAVAEAQAAGIPVVALDSPGIREMMRFGGGVVMGIDASPLAFAKAIRDISQQTVTARDLLRQKALEAAAGFTTARMAEAAEALYESLIARTASQPRKSSFFASLAAERRLLDGLLDRVPTADVWGNDA